MPIDAIIRDLVPNAGAGTDRLPEDGDRPGAEPLRLGEAPFVSAVEFLGAGVWRTD